MDNPFQETLDELNEELRIRKARTNYLDYVCYTNPEYIASKFHTYLCNQVDSFLKKKTNNAFDILLLSVPPQFGKSTTVSETLPSYYLGKNPKDKIIICGYNEDFAIRFGRRNLEKIQEFGAKIFPELHLAQSPCSNVEFETTDKGRCISRGILSGLTGNTADLFIIDDPIKNRQEAMSETTANVVWNEYLNSVRTRIKPGGKLIIIATRWAENDLIGMILKNEKHYKVINIPCECDEPENDPLGRKLGEALCPEIGRGNAWLKDFKSVYVSKEGSMAWTSLYQGRPTALQGNIVKREWWKFYDKLPEDIPYWAISVDANFKDGDDNDFAAVQVWGKLGHSYYLIDLVKQHLSFLTTLDAIRMFLEKYPKVGLIFIEDKANGSALINVLSKEFEGVIPINPQGGKSSRLQAVSPAIERGDVWLPKFASFTQDFIDEFAAFPNGSHDDQVDAATQMLNRMIYVDAEIVTNVSIKTRLYRIDQLQDFERADDNLKEELIRLWGYPSQYYD